MGATDGSEFDVVVAGAGLAGLVCALTVAEAGASVAMLEKGAEAGGSSAQSGGGLVFVGTDLQIQAGVTDSVESLREDLLHAAQGRAQPELVDAYVTNQLDTYHWLCGQGLQFSLPTSGTGVARAHLTGRGIATRHLYERVLAAHRITFLPNTAARRLIRHADDHVQGVEVSTERGNRMLSARAGVVLATGGFARSEELLRRFAPQWVNSVKMGGPHNTGDGITLARALGADLVDMPYVAASFGASIARYPDLTLDPDENPILLYPNYLGGIIVNLDGVRFANESLNYKILSHLCADQREGAAVQIFDAEVFARSDPRAMPRDIQSAYDAGLVVEADSVRELARALRFEPDALHDTVDRYNGFVLAGRDADFGRPMTYSAGPGGGLITTSPFYGFPTRPGLTSTYAGLAVDGQMRVIDVHGAPIAGLYAAGETVGGFHGAGYYSGTALGKAAIFGRIAGTSVMNDCGRTPEPYTL